MSELDALRKRLEDAAANPPSLTVSTRSQQLPQTIRPALDSRGQRRPQMRGTDRAVQAARDAARREMVAGARTELVEKARKQLQP